MNADFMKESKTIDYVVSLGLEAVKDKVKTEWEAKQVRDRLKNYISRQQKINWSCTREEEIDFGGLTHYIQTDLLDDVQERLFGNRKERGMARKSIISKATCYAQAHTSLSRQRAIWMTETAIDILHEFYKSRINRELKFIAAQIEDAVGEIATEQTKEIVQTVQASEERVIKELKNAAKNIGNMSIEKNMQLMRQGDIGQVEDTVSNFFAAIGSTHILFPNYRYEYKGEKGQLYSKPLTKEALEKYPPRISCTGTIQMNGEYLQKFDVNTIDYANRHQLPITLNVITAKKLLGNIDDPIQHEAEKLIGESFIIQPKPFPPAFPCSISLDGNVMFDYILFRTEEILDDGTIIISNREQENCPFRIGMSVNMKLGKTTYSVDTVEPTNEELLQTSNSSGASPKVTELPVTIRIDRRPDDVIMNMRFVDVGADHKGMIALGEPPGKFYAQPVGFLRCDLSGPERLAHMVGDHIICTAHASGGGNILPLCQQKLCISSPAVTSIAGNQFSVVGLLGICHIINDVADCLTFGAALADMQRHDACGCHRGSLLSKRKGQLCELSFG